MQPKKSKTTITFSKHHRKTVTSTRPANLKLHQYLGTTKRASKNRSEIPEVGGKNGDLHGGMIVFGMRNLSQ